MVKLATYNIQYSKGKDGRFELDRIADAVRDADVICLQEVVRNVPGIPDPDQPARLGELLPQHHWVYGPAVDLDAGGDPGVDRGGHAEQLRAVGGLRGDHACSTSRRACSSRSSRTA